MKVRPQNCPCKECAPPKRHYGCHGSCKPYTEWAKNRREAVDALKKEADMEADIRKLHAGAVRKEMDKFITLCFECRDLFREFYRVDVEDSAATEKKGGKDPVCENCGARFGLKVCRIRTKTNSERRK